jgi:hypothetical protein
MRLAIISDSHDNIPNIEKLLSWAKEHKIQTIIHCGDIASGDTAEFLAKHFSGDIHLVYGNMDFAYRDDIYLAIDNHPNAVVHGDEGSIVIPAQAGIQEINLAFCHFPEQAKKLAETGKYDLVFYGHTHKPWMETLPNNCQLINPGTLGGVFQKASFAVYDTQSGKLELKILELL